MSHGTNSLHFVGIAKISDFSRGLKIAQDNLSNLNETKEKALETGIQKYKENHPNIDFDNSILLTNIIG
jgi:hypothetical protein